MEYIGRSIPSKTNPQLVAGRGKYVGDFYLPGMTYAAVVRSPYAHAHIRSIDARAALALPGVLCVATGDEVMAEMQPPPPAFDRAGMGAREYDSYALTAGEVRYVGEPVAAVVAEDKFTAYRAAELVDIAYEELPVVTDVEKAIEPGSPLVREDWGDNVLCRTEFHRGDAERALQEADGTIQDVIRLHRHTAVPMEPRGYLADYDPFEETLTLYASTQGPHPLRGIVAHSLRMPESQVRVVQPHVGGAFGGKALGSQEDTLIAYLARRVGRPVKWIEQRMENFLAAGHAREEVLEFEAGYTADGRVTALRVKVIADVGAPSSFYGWTMSYVTTVCIPTAYQIDNCDVALCATVTNKCPWSGYRGFGKEAASFLMERVMDLVAERVGQDPAAIRLKNFIPSDQFPYEQVSGAMVDSGDYAGVLQKALDMVAYKEFPKQQAEAKARGRYVGIGIGFELTPEGCTIPNSPVLQGYEGATVRVSPTGQVTVLTGATSPGSGNETGISQMVAEELGANIADIKIIQGDTQVCPYGLGNFSSRAVLIGGTAAGIAAGQLREKMLKVAGKMLEVAPQDLEARDGTISVKGAPARAVTFRDVAGLVYRHCYGPEASDVEPGLEATRYYKIGNVYHRPEVDGRLSVYPTWPNGACVAVVEVDPETGRVKILRCAMVHDCGVMVNPLLADANLHGSLAQALGGALYEHLVYDDNGQLQTATFMDYTIPTAVDLPDYEVGHHVTPSPSNPLGMKGAGESGITGPVPAVVSAVVDALAQTGVRLNILETPLTPNRVWRVIQEARAAA